MTTSCRVFTLVGANKPHLDPGLTHAQSPLWVLSLDTMALCSVPLKAPLLSGRTRTASWRPASVHTPAPVTHNATQFPGGHAGEGQKRGKE